MLQGLLGVGIAAERPYLDVVAELQCVGLLAYTADKCRTFPFRFQVVAAEDHLVNFRLYNHRVAEYVLGIVLAYLVVNA